MIDNINLYNGNSIPALGFGTFLLKGEDCTKSVIEAIKLGYRHIDTAVAYENEEAVGNAIEYCIKNDIISREELFINTKLSHHKPIGYENTIKSFNESLQRLKVDYIDSYLIHWPNATKDDSWKRLNADTWRAMEDLYDKGLIKNIGVSNFEIHHLEELLKTARIKPVINQLNLSPVWQQKELVKFCTENGINIGAWQTIVMENWARAVLLPVACKYNRSIPQICLRWGLQKGYVVLAKTDIPEFMADNMQIFDFEIEQDDIDKMDTLNSHPSGHICQPDALYGVLEFAEKESKRTFIQKQTFKLFNVIPIMQSKYYYKNDNLDKVMTSLFGIIPIIKNKIKSKEKSKTYLFGFIPIGKFRRKIETVNYKIIPEYNVEKLCRM